MAGKKVTPDDVKRFNELYYELHNFKKVAEITGFSSGTVSKYTDRNWKPKDESTFKRVSMDDVPEPHVDDYVNIKNLGDVCKLTEDEEKDIALLWLEMEV